MEKKCSCLWFSQTFKKKLTTQWVRGVKRIRAGVILHYLPENKFLLVETYYQHLGFPKGGQEPGETLAQTAVRELKEETGIELEEQLVSRLRRFSYGGSTTYFYFPFQIFPPAWKSLSIDPSPTNDVTGNGWLEFTCFAEDIRCNSHLKKFIKEFRRKGSLCSEEKSSERHFKK